MIGYHGTTTTNAIKILSEGFKVPKNKKNLWLGFGVYFFQEEIYAFKWIFDLYKREHEIEDLEKLSEEMKILQVNLDLNQDRLLDLATYEGKLLFDKTYKVIQTSTNPKLRKIIENKKYVAAVVIDYLFEKLNAGTMYDAVKEIYRINQRNYQYILNMTQAGLPQCQICVKNLKIIKDIQIMKYEEKIDNYLTSWNELISTQPLIKIRSDEEIEYK